MRKSSEPHLPPVEKIELSSAHSGRRMTLAAVFLVIGVAALAYGFIHLMGASGGWQQIEASTGREASCADDFILYYNLGAGQTSANAENKALSQLYGDAAIAALRMFSNSAQWPEEHNVRYLNEHPNETVTVQPGLYKALETVQASGDRTLYLGPVYELYNNVFTCMDDAQTAEFDPRQNDETRQYFAECTAFARDRAAVDVELLGDGQVRLNVSEEYMAFAREQQIVSFISFDWMENAFITDYLADTLVENGYTNGVLSSYDGFVRNLGGSSEQFGINFYDGALDDQVLAATVVYGSGLSGAYLRGYPMSDRDAYRYYTMEDGAVLSPYLDTADGMCRGAASGLLCCSWQASCTQVLLRMIPVYVADTLSVEALDALTAEGIYSVWCQDETVFYNTDELSLSGLYESEDLRYTAQLRQAQ